MYEIQKTDYTCAPVAIRNAYRKLGYPPPRISGVIAGVGCSKGGTRLSNMEKYLRDQGFSTMRVNLEGAVCAARLSSAAVILFLRISEARNHAVLVEEASDEGLTVVNHVQGSEYFERYLLGASDMKSVVAALLIFG